MSVFKNAVFIKPEREINKSFVYSNYAPMFRKKFIINEKISSSKIYVCSLGYGYVFINGKEITKDKFTAPVSDYCKTLWYSTYNVTDLLVSGENVISVWCGNGWYNEEMKTSWNYNEAKWRDVPKTIIRLDVNNKTVVTSDKSFKCLPESAVYFNQLRSGEYFNANEYDEDWNKCDFDDSAWENAIEDKYPPTGEFRECMCEPIREFEAYHAEKIVKVCDKKFLFDIGQNIAGYIRLKTNLRKGTRLVIKYCEQVNDDGTVQLNKMTKHYPESEFQTDIVICSGKEFVWSPRFCYHGFRYILIDGIDDINGVDVSGIFVHQAVERKTTFECSNQMLNKMFKAGIYSVYSNMYYQLTDCPTREKLGWTNDAQASVEQILTNFKAENVLKKWLQDIYDAMKDDGSLPGIIPTSGWGYHWGNGPVSDGILFELPYRIYLHTGDCEPLCKSLPYFKKYLNYLRSRVDADGFLRFGLYDWAKPGFDVDAEFADVPLEFINEHLIFNFNRIAAISAELNNETTETFEAEMKNSKEKIVSSFIDKSGKCTVNKQTAVAMLIYYDICDNIAPLKEQLAKLIEDNEFHHDCGMVGLRRLYMALNKCGLQEYAYKIITAEGYATYYEWFENGATTLWETWDVARHDDSKNHHMYSDFMSWIVKTIIGINFYDANTVDIKPYIFSQLTYAKGSIKTKEGEISVYWKKTKEETEIEVIVPENLQVTSFGKKLKSGKNKFRL